MHIMWGATFIGILGTNKESDYILHPSFVHACMHACIMSICRLACRYVRVNTSVHIFQTGVILSCLLDP